MVINHAKLLPLCLILYSLSISVSASHCLTCTYSNACHLSDRYDHCTDCPNLVEDANSDLKGFLYNANSAITRICHIGAEKEKCILETESANEILQTLVDTIFPRVPTEESNLLTCSHLLFLCPDKDSKGMVIENGSWSCYSCELFLNHLFTILNTRLPKVSKAMSTILYPTKDPDCVVAFTDVFQVSGILGDFIKNKIFVTSI